MSLNSFQIPYVYIQYIFVCTRLRLHQQYPRGLVVSGSHASVPNSPRI